MFECVASPGLYPIPLPDASLALDPAFLAASERAAVLAQLLAETPWRSEPITLFGRTVPQPRLLAWHGDADAIYTYSGIRHTPLPWTPLLRDLRHRVERASGARFNSVLLNYYRNERDSMGLHADDEPELGARPVIASLSLGAERRLVFRHRRRRELANLNLPLPDGSLLIMAGGTQQHWQHGLRKQTRPCGARVNLTFRWVFGSGAAAAAGLGRVRAPGRTD
jgi:alkylated DNA repair dioxygenase AlkB